MTDNYQWSQHQYADEALSLYYSSLKNLDEGNTSHFTEHDISRMTGLLVGLSFSFKEGNLIPVIMAIVVSRFMTKYKMVTFSNAA